MIPEVFSSHIGMSKGRYILLFCSIKTEIVNSFYCLIAIELKKFIIKWSYFSNSFEITVTMQK